MERYTWIDKDDGVYVNTGDIGWIEYEIGHRVYCGDAIDKLAEYENEAEQKEKGCEYCNDNLYIKTTQYAAPILAPLTPEQELRDELLNMTGEKYVKTDKRYCYMCGRKLRD